MIHHEPVKMKEEFSILPRVTLLVADSMRATQSVALSLMAEPFAFVDAIDPYIEVREMLRRLYFKTDIFDGVSDRAIIDVASAVRAHEPEIIAIRLAEEINRTIFETQTPVVHSLIAESSHDVEVLLRLPLRERDIAIIYFDDVEFSPTIDFPPHIRQYRISTPSVGAIASCEEIASQFITSLRERIEECS